MAEARSRCRILRSCLADRILNAILNLTNQVNYIYHCDTGLLIFILGDAVAIARPTAFQPHNRRKFNRKPGSTSSPDNSIGLDNTSTSDPSR